MELNTQLDVESSKISGKIIFSCDDFELTHEDIIALKKKKLIRAINEEDLPETIPCQGVIFLENDNKAKIIFFNPSFILPESIFDNPLLNKDIIDRSRKNGGFRIEFSTPIYDTGIKINFSYNI